MAEEDFKVELIEPPTKKGKLTNQQILLGEKRDPFEILRGYSDADWEEFVREWAEALTSDYFQVRRASGKGDRGRDVIGYVGDVNAGGPWDNFQCKHYDHALHPGDLWKELAKLCYYTFEKKYSVPRAYYFVAPRGVGPEALLLLEKPEELRAGLIAQWEKGDLLKIGKKDVLIEGALREYVELFDFNIVKDLPPSRLIEGHRKTRFHARRFGGGLVGLPPTKAEVPDEIAPHETRYVEQLLGAYGDHLGIAVTTMQDLAGHPKMRNHFNRQRTHFYLAELLRNFTRDGIDEEGCFERLQDTIYEGVIDVAESDYSSGFERVKKTLAEARAIQVDSHPLKECLELYHRSGMCHQLANDDRLTWVP
jgi:hypothetical protein